MSILTFLTDKIVKLVLKSKDKSVWPKEKDWRPDSFLFRCFPDC